MSLPRHQSAFGARDAGGGGVFFPDVTLNSVIQLSRGTVEFFLGRDSELRLLNIPGGQWSFFSVVTLNFVT